MCVQGENCIAAGRLFVEETIYDEFVQRYNFNVTESGVEIYNPDPTFEIKTESDPEQNEIRIRS